MKLSPHKFNYYVCNLNLHLVKIKIILSNILFMHNLQDHLVIKGLQILIIDEIF